MIEAAAALPRKFGYNWWNEDKCNTDEEKNNVCKDFFSQIDENGDGSVSFEEWLEFAMKHFQERCRNRKPIETEITQILCNSHYNIIIGIITKSKRQNVESQVKGKYLTLESCHIKNICRDHRLLHRPCIIDLMI